MTPEEFVYWLQGWTELEQGKLPTEDQWKMIVAHLTTIFTKITPDFDDISQHRQRILEEEDTGLDALSNIDPDEMTKMLQEAVEELKDTKSVFEPTRHHPSISPGPDFPGPLICEADSDTKFCCSAVDDLPRPVLPRKLYAE